MDAKNSGMGSGSSRRIATRKHLELVNSFIKSNSYQGAYWDGNELKCFTWAEPLGDSSDDILQTVHKVSNTNWRDIEVNLYKDKVDNFCCGLAAM